MYPERCRLPFQSLAPTLFFRASLKAVSFADSIKERGGGCICSPQRWVFSLAKGSHPGSQNTFTKTRYTIHILLNSRQTYPKGLTRHETFIIPTIKNRHQLIPCILGLNFRAAEDLHLCLKKDKTCRPCMWKTGSKHAIMHIQGFLRQPETWTVRPIQHKQMLFTFC